MSKWKGGGCGVEMRAVHELNTYIIFIEYTKYQWRKFAWITLWKELFVYFNETLYVREKKR